MPLKDTIAGFRGILDGEYDDIPEELFLFAGGIDDVTARWEKAKQEKEA